MGTPDFAVPSLKLVASNFNVITVFSQPARPNGRGMKSKKSSVEIAARELNITQPAITKRLINLKNFLTLGYVQENLINFRLLYKENEPILVFWYPLIL